MPVRGKIILHVEIRDTKADTSKMRLCRQSTILESLNDITVIHNAKSSMIANDINKTVS